MKRSITPLLVCPVCLPKERPLEIGASAETDGDITTGHLSCRKCRRRFPIRDSIAVLLPEGKGGSIAPPLTVTQEGTVWRKLRSHRNHFERIRSGFLVAER